MRCVAARNGHASTTHNRRGGSRALRRLRPAIAASGAAASGSPEKCVPLLPPRAAGRRVRRTRDWAAAGNKRSQAVLVGWLVDGRVAPIAQPPCFSRSAHHTTPPRHTVLCRNAGISHEVVDILIRTAFLKLPSSSLHAARHSGGRSSWTLATRRCTPQLAMACSSSSSQCRWLVAAAPQQLLAPITAPRRTRRCGARASPVPAGHETAVTEPQQQPRRPVQQAVAQPSTALLALTG